MNEVIKMLQIDDKSLTSNLDRAGYRQMGVQVLSATNLKDAVSIIKDKKVQIVVVNYDYNDIDAVSVCRSLKRTFEDIPVVVTSVQSSTKIQSSAIDAGASLFIEQPMPRTFFIEKIKGLLSHSVRGQSRVKTEALGHVKIELEGNAHQFPIQDVSSSGMLVATGLEVGAGAKVQLTFSLPGTAQQLIVGGEVIRRVEIKKGEFGLGIRFDYFEGESQKALDSFISYSNLDQKELMYYL